MPPNIPTKVLEYENFLENVLKRDLQILEKERGDLVESRQHFEDLQKNIELILKHHVRKLRLNVDIGNQVFVQADVQDTGHIFVDIGLGFHVEFTLLEALDFISKKRKYFISQVDERASKIADIKAQIKLVVEGIRELMNIPS